MSRQRTPAVVLRRWPYSESSLAVHLLTPGQGVVSVLAKGVHRPTSGSWGVLDTWALVEAEYGGHESREMLTLYGARLLDRCSGLARDPEHLIAAGLVAELAELAAPPGMSADAAFDYLMRRLRQLDAGVDVPGFLCAALLEGLDLLGLGPLLDAGPGVRASWQWFSPAAGGVLPAGAPRPAEHARRVSTDALEWLARLRAAGPAPGVVAERAPARVADALTILGEFAAYHLERPPRAWSLLRARGRRLARLR
ncbi:MAG: hypothetical protein EYC70_00125 [Planctomycetota bacterium]|nr:MAG: hypothetical protein EYC70_00125 [Planctomycetota bacterium]